MFVAALFILESNSVSRREHRLAAAAWSSRHRRSGKLSRDREIPAFVSGFVG